MPIFRTRPHSVLCRTLAVHCAAVERIPLSLTLLRAALAPVLILLAWVYPRPWAFAVCLVLGAVSDYFDGAIARRLGTVTPNLRRLDSLVDALFYLSALLAAWRLYPQTVAGYLTPLSVLIGLELLSHAVAYAKLGREASYHLRSSKLWGAALFVGAFSLLALGSDGLAVSLAIWLGLVPVLEGLAVTCALREWRTDVPSVFHAVALRRAAATGRATAAQRSK